MASSVLISNFTTKLRRVVEESLEVSFIVCNNEMEQFGMSKIFDVFCQIFSTGYVLNTGYWPFFSTYNGQCLCVCGRFGILCRHNNKRCHTLDMEPIENAPGSPIFYPKLYGPAVPEDSQILMNPLPEDPFRYELFINLIVNYSKIERNKQRRHSKYAALINNPPITQNFTFKFQARFKLCREYYRPHYDVMFQPLPFYLPQYGSYFKNLLLLRTMENSDFYNIQGSTGCISASSMPFSTFELTHVNIPTYKFPQQQYAYYCQKPQLRSHNLPRKRSVRKARNSSLTMARTSNSLTFNEYNQTQNDTFGNINSVTRMSASKDISANYEIYNNQPSNVDFHNVIIKSELEQNEILAEYDLSASKVISANYEGDNHQPSNVDFHNVIKSELEQNEILAEYDVSASKSISANYEAHMNQQSNIDFYNVVIKAEPFEENEILADFDLSYLVNSNVTNSYSSRFELDSTYRKQLEWFEKSIKPTKMFREDETDKELNLIQSYLNEKTNSMNYDYFYSL